MDRRKIDEQEMSLDDCILLLIVVFVAVVLFSLYVPAESLAVYANPAHEVQ